MATPKPTTPVPSRLKPSVWYVVPRAVLRSMSSSVRNSSGFRNRDCSCLASPQNVPPRTRSPPPAIVGTRMLGRDTSFVTAGLRASAGGEAAIRFLSAWTLALNSSKSRAIRGETLRGSLTLGASDSADLKAVVALSL